MEVLQWLFDTVGDVSGLWAYLLIFALLLACGLGLPMPEDITLIAGGWIAFKGNADPMLMTLVSLTGVMVGDSIIFVIGSRYGTKILKTRYFSRFLTAERLAYAQRQLLTRGNRLIFFARFMPGLRAPIYFTCGTLQLPFRTFFFFDGMAAILSVPAIIYATFHFGSDIENVIDTVRKFEYGILFLVAAALAIGGIKWWVSKKKSQKSQTLVMENKGLG